MAQVLYIPLALSYWIRRLYLLPIEGDFMSPKEQQSAMCPSSLYNSDFSNC